MVVAAASYFAGQTWKRDLQETLESHFPKTAFAVKVEVVAFAYSVVAAVAADVAAAVVVVAAAAVN